MSTGGSGDHSFDGRSHAQALNPSEGGNVIQPPLQEPWSTSPNASNLLPGVPSWMLQGLPLLPGMPPGLQRGLPLGTSPLGTSQGPPLGLLSGLPMGLSSGLLSGMPLGLPPGLHSVLPLGLSSGLPLGMPPDLLALMAQGGLHGGAPSLPQVRLLPRREDSNTEPVIGDAGADHGADDDRLAGQSTRRLPVSEGPQATGGQGPQATGGQGPQATGGIGPQAAGGVGGASPLSADEELASGIVAPQNSDIIGAGDAAPAPTHACRPRLKRQKAQPSIPRKGVATGGRRKGALTVTPKCCHGCRTNTPRGGVTHVCRGIEEGGGAPTATCVYWVCGKCYARWTDCDVPPDNFYCCIHGGPKDHCPCSWFRQKLASQRKGPVPILQRSEQAMQRKVTTSVFQFPTPNPPTSPSPSTTPTTYSVCTSTSLLRVSLISTADHFMCSRKECKTIETLKRASHGEAETNLLERCPHADVVYEAKRALTPIPAADPLFATKLEFEKALEQLPAGSLNQTCIEKMHSRASAAEKEGLPLLVRLGKNSGWFGVREGVSFNRTIVGGWAHVKCDGLEGCGAIRDDRKSRSSRFLQCKANNGSPCSEMLVGKKTARCVHVSVVALHLYAAGMYTIDEDEEQDDEEGVGEGAEGPVDLWGVQEEAGYASHTRADEPGLASSAQLEDPVHFKAQLAMVQKIGSSVSIPVEEPKFKPGTFGRGKISVHENICTGCLEPYTVLPDADAVLVAQGHDVRVVHLERKECRGCNLKGWAGDNIFEDGVFNFNGNVVIELPVLYLCRDGFRSGTPITTWWTEYLRPRFRDSPWLLANGALGWRIQDHNFVQILKDAYFAFEALSAHPVDFVSYLYGRYPEVLAIDGCAKVVTDNVSTAQFDVARQERYVDADLQHQLLKLSMTFNMVSSKRLVFSMEAAPTFGPHNRVGNLMLRTKRGKVPPRGSPQDGDVGQLMQALGDRGINDLKTLDKSHLQSIYRLCYGGGKGMSNYTTKDALAKCLEDLWTVSGVGERCSKMFIARPSGRTSGVEGLFTSDGVMYAHVFLVTAESPAEVVDAIVHLEVKPVLLVTDVPCMVAPIALKLCPELLQDGGVLPRNAQGIVSIPALQSLSSRDPTPNGHHTGLQGQHTGLEDLHTIVAPAQGFPSPVANVYAVFQSASVSEDVQPHLSFRSLLRQSTLDFEKVAQLDGVRDASGSPIRICELVEGMLDSLRQQGCYAMTLFEVVVVSEAWFGLAGKGRPTCAGGRVQVVGVVDEGERLGAVGAVGAGETEGTSKHRDQALSELCAMSCFLQGVLAVGVGSITGQPPAPPAFLKSALFEDVPVDAPEDTVGTTLRALGLAVGQYHEMKVAKIVNGLGAQSDDLLRLAHRLVKAGVGFGAAEHSVKALQIALSVDGLGGGADAEGKLPGFNVSFNFKRDISAGSGHHYAGSKLGTCFGPDGPHEDNHEGSCKEKFGGLSLCPQLVNVNLNPHEQNHSKKTKHLASINGMAFDTFTFTTTLLNELENKAINQRTCDSAVHRSKTHPKSLRTKTCCSDVWTCGRCFCEKPHMRSFDAFGIMRVTRLPTNPSNSHT